MELEGVKQDFQSTVSDVWPRVKRQLRQASQQREPEVHVLILVTKLQALSHHHTNVHMHCFRADASAYDLTLEVQLAHATCFMTVSFRIDILHTALCAETNQPTF